MLEVRRSRTLHFPSKEPQWSPKTMPEVVTNIILNSPRYSNSKLIPLSDYAEVFFFSKLEKNANLFLVVFMFSCSDLESLQRDIKPQPNLHV